MNPETKAWIRTIKTKLAFFQFFDRLFKELPFWEAPIVSDPSSLIKVSFLICSFILSSEESGIWNSNLMLTPSEGTLRVSLFLTVVIRVDSFWALIVLRSDRFNFKLVNFFSSTPAGSSHPINSILGGSESNSWSSVDWIFSDSLGTKNTFVISFFDSSPKNKTLKLSVPNAELALLKF